MEMAKKLIKPIVLAICILVVLYAVKDLEGSRTKLKYNEHLSDTAVTIDGENVTFEDLAFYILYEERVIEEQARIYNPDSTKDYWNLHSNDSFIQMEAKDAVINMAIHDRLFYQLAKAEGMDSFTDEEEEELTGATTDFWEDLLDIQWKKLPCDEDTINEQIRIVAVAEKYEKYLAETKGPTEAAYKYDGYYYGLIRADHEIEVNDKLWDRFVMGDITLTHSGVNYINGLTDAQKKEN